MVALILAGVLALVRVGRSEPLSIPPIHIEVGNGDRVEEMTVGMKILFLLTVLSLAPAILVMVTSFTRIVVVLSLLRQALGLHSMPPNQVIVGLALFLTFFVMSPVWNQVNHEALQPYLAKEISEKEAMKKALTPIRAFMLKQTREKDLKLFLDISKGERPRNLSDVPTMVIVPAFVTSELKTAFQIGFFIYIPFMILDMVVASVLLSMGMLMLPPMMIVLPFKLLLFVLVDGWYLLIGSLVKSFG
ncbi:MAG: flagellar type III secretion system pore protein FliP [Deltaproteobacteria bacterium]|nr:flagellar type III secretion system pore protein FliP [Deltaproteobacteria bacterium]